MLKYAVSLKAGTCFCNRLASKSVDAGTSDRYVRVRDVGGCAPSWPEELLKERVGGPGRVLSPPSPRPAELDVSLSPVTLTTVLAIPLAGYPPPKKYTPAGRRGPAASSGLTNEMATPAGQELCPSSLLNDHMS